MESRKMVLKNLFTGQEWRNRHREQTYGHGETGEEGEMYGESNMETYITICKIDSKQEFAVWLRKLKQGSVSTQRDGMGSKVGGRFKSEGIYVYLWLIHVEVCQKTKDKHHILTHIYGNQKNDTAEFIYRAAIEKQTQRIDLWTRGDGRRG